MTKKMDWVVVANGAQARILEKPRADDSEWTEVNCLVYPDARLHGKDIDGKTKGHTIAGRSGLAPHREQKNLHRQKFCKQIAEKLQTESQINLISEITIFASAQILGELLNQMEEHTKKLIVNTYSKDLTSLSLDELTKRFHEDFHL